METVSNELTWFEEWCLYFEVLWLQSHTWWEDLTVIYNKSNTQTLRRVFNSKSQIAFTCCTSWPVYASFQEDRDLCKEKWNAKYETKRIVQWDDTNVPFNYKPRKANNQQLAYSSYYSMNCAKGGVYLQLCGWLGVADLWVGATSDSHYQEHSGIFERQEAFAAADLVNDVILPFSIIFDKGYCCVLAAHWAGGQECIQPIFARSDQRFNDRKTVISSLIASNWSGNERGK